MFSASPKKSENLICPETEGIKYAGSKLKLLPFILRLAESAKPRTIFDGFAGTTRVSQAFAQSGYRVTANDISVWSKTFALCYLKNERDARFYQKIVNHLNDLPERDGWFTAHYGGAASAKSSADASGFKKPWQIRNTRKLDAIRAEIENLDLNEIERAVVLTALILALDKVDSTLGHFSSYLNEWSPRSFNRLKLEVPRLFKSEKEHAVYNEDVFEIAENVEADLAYFDPPYGSNNEKMPASRVRYAAYYHLWTTVILNDEPEIFGRVKRRADTSDKRTSSPFEDFRRTEAGDLVAVKAIESLIQKTRARHIILSYSSGGRATVAQLYKIFRASGEILESVKIDYKKNVMAMMRSTDEWTPDVENKFQEFLFLLRKN